MEAASAAKAKEMTPDLTTIITIMVVTLSWRTRTRFHPYSRTAARFASATSPTAINAGSTAPSPGVRELADNSDGGNSEIPAHRHPHKPVGPRGQMQSRRAHIAMRIHREGASDRLKEQHFARERIMKRRTGQR